MKKYLKVAALIFVSLTILYILFPKAYNPVTYVTNSGPNSFFFAQRDFCYGLSIESNLCVGIVLSKADKNVLLH